MECGAVGVPPPQLEWRKNGKRVSTQRVTVKETPSGNSVLRIEPVRAGRDDAEYECVAENGVGEPARAHASLTVVPEEELPPGFPTIVQQPAMTGVEKGRSATLPCLAEGSPDPVIRWHKDMSPLDMTVSRYAIVQGGSLQISDAEEDDQGEYECVAENSLGTSFSNVAMLYVRVRRVPPYFSIPPEPIYEVMPGAHLNITCVAVGSPMPYVKWRKGAVDMTPEHSIPIGKNVLLLDNIQESANYTCIASSKLGNIEALAQITVRALPRSPTNVRISDVTATSIRLSWSYDIGSENILYYVIQYKPKQANQEYSEISGITTTYYTVRDLSPYTEYEFYVIAMNTIGRGSPSTPIVVTTGETEPGSAPRNVQARPLSSSVVVIQWDPPKEPNGQVTGYKVYYTTSPTLQTTAWHTQTVDTNQLTTISDLTPHTIYTIRIQAFTSRGPGPLSAPVQVKTQQGVPSQPTNLRVVATSSTTVQVSWTQPSHSGEKVVGYEVYWNDTFTQQQYSHPVEEAQTSHLLENLYPDTLYFVWVSAKSRAGEGAATPPVSVRTEQYVGAETSVWTPGATRFMGCFKCLVPLPKMSRVKPLTRAPCVSPGNPPPRALHHGAIAYYKVKYARGGDEEVTTVRVEDPSQHFIILGDLQKWTSYSVWVIAGTTVGDGPPSPPFHVRTDEDVPGEPHQVKVTPINSTTILVQWQPPADRDRNGLIRGYQIHVQETTRIGDLVNEPRRYDVASEKAQEYNVTGLQPDTDYAVQVAAVTRRGDGTRSRVKTARTLGGVPTRPEMKVQLTGEEPQVTVNIAWSRPSHTYGQLLSYRLRYGRVVAGGEEANLQEVEINPLDHHTTIPNLDRGARYEFRLSGRNGRGWGQEVVNYLDTPEGEPTAPPQNISHRLQSPTTAVISWGPPLPQYSNGYITHYGYQFHKSTDVTALEKNTTHTRIVISLCVDCFHYQNKHMVIRPNVGIEGNEMADELANEARKLSQRKEQISLDENMEYVFRVRAYTVRGGGPWSTRLAVETPGDVPPAPTNVQAMATSDQSVEVWWDEVPYFHDILGYQVLYTQTPEEDLDSWKVKQVPLTWSAELEGLESHSMYAVRVAAILSNQGLGRLSDLITVKVTPTGRGQDKEKKLQSPTQKDLKILQLNVEGFTRAKGEIIEKMMREHKADVIALQETHTPENSKSAIRIPGYVIICSKPHPKFGLAIYITYKLREETKVLPETSHSIGIQINDLSIYNVYKPPSQLWIPTSLPSPQHPAIVLGDFNSHHTLWGYSSTDNEGESLNDWMEINDMQLIFDAKKQGTFQSARWGKTYSPDLCFVTKDQCDNPIQIAHKILTKFPKSQHCPSIYEMGIQIPQIDSAPIPRWNLGKANWEAFTKYIEDNINLIPPTPKNYSRASNLIISCAKKFIPRGHRKIYIPCWSPESERLYQEYNLSGNTETAENLIRSLDDSRKHRWHTMLEQMDFSKSSRKSWSLLRKLGGADPPHKHNQLTNPNKIATCISSKSRIHPNPSEKSRLKKVIGTNLSKSSTHPQLSTNIDLNEVEDAIKVTHNNRAPGPDGIMPEFMKHLGQKAIKWMAKLFTNILSTGSIPSVWKQAKVLAILKPGKTSDDPNNYRPISLLCIPYKILERIILNRISPIIEEYLPIEQAGFRPGRNCAEQTLALTTTIEDGFQKKLKTGAVFVDLTAAYDTVWREGLLYKLSKIINCKNIIKLINNFLTNRKITVHLNNKKSRPRTLNNGLPQGSVLAPLLFNVYTADIPATNSQKFLYADDIALLHQEQSFSTLEQILNEDLKKLENFFSKWHLIPNPSKTVSSVFHLNNHKANRPLKLTFCNKPLSHDPCPKYLGVTLDRSLTFRQHLEKTRDKLKTRNNIMTRLAGTTWGCSADTLRTTALALVYSVAEYCAPVLITGNMRPTPIDWLPYLSNIAPPDLRRKKSTSNLLSKIKAKTKLPINTVLEIPPPTRLISRNPAWVADENVDLKEEWRNRWSNLAIANKDLVEDPNTKPPGYNLPRRTWSTLNRIRTSTGRCNYLLNKWNMSPDQNCDCGQIQTMHHILRDCPRRFFQGTLGDIHRCTEEALEWIRHLDIPL
ncbi:PTPRD [Cordylochernes scorpioides]|uniref:PTPRD n=1 Tax=Cordylochernes scorpioides TaxID=51811 RepID=A0ABY6KWA5_9ARAC|nr:PTPRD [Cordylochernes scorpioides]